MPGMHPVANERRFAGEMLGLRNFACMMRKGEVGTAAVNINLRAEVAHGHGAALYMPARTARTPRAGPCRFAGCLRLPENKVKWVFFAYIVGEVAALIGDGKHGRIIVQADGAGHNAKIRVFPNTEIDIATALIRITFGDQRLDDLNHAGYLVGGAGVDGGTLDVQDVHVAEILLGFAIAQFVPRHAKLTRLAQDIVVNIGNVLHIAHRVATELQVTPECIKGDVGEGMAQVCCVVRRDAADIHSNFFIV